MGKRRKKVKKKKANAFHGQEDGKTDELQIDRKSAEKGGSCPGEGTALKGKKLQIGGARERSVRRILLGKKRHCAQNTGFPP